MQTAVPISSLVLSMLPYKLVPLATTNKSVVGSKIGCPWFSLSLALHRRGPLPFSLRQWSAPSVLFRWCFAICALPTLFTIVLSIYKAWLGYPDLSLTPFYVGAWNPILCWCTFSFTKNGNNLLEWRCWPPSSSALDSEQHPRVLEKWGQPWIWQLWFGGLVVTEVMLLVLTEVYFDSWKCHN